jgi:hypothetical protein
MTENCKVVGFHKLLKKTSSEEIKPQHENEEQFENEPGEITKGSRQEQLNLYFSRYSVGVEAEKYGCGPIRLDMEKTCPFGNSPDNGETPVCGKAFSRSNTLVTHKVSILPVFFTKINCYIVFI